MAWLTFMYVTFIEALVLTLLLFFRNHALPEGFENENEVRVAYTKTQLFVQIVFSVIATVSSWNIALDASHLEKVQKEFANLEILFSFNNTL